MPLPARTNQFISSFIILLTKQTNGKRGENITSFMEVEMNKSKKTNAYEPLFLICWVLFLVSCLLWLLSSATHGSSQYLIKVFLPVSFLIPSQEWYPHFFVLTMSKIYYSEETSNNQGNDDEEEHREVSRPDLLSEKKTWTRRSTQFTHSMSNTWIPAWVRCNFHFENLPGFYRISLHNAFLSVLFCNSNELNIISLCL